MKTETVSISQLVSDPSNARKHSTKNLESIKGSLAKFGQQKPIVVSSGNVVVAGNGTLEAARALGWDQIAIVRTELTGTDATAFAIADNRTGELAEWEAGILSDTLKALLEEDFDLNSIGFSDEDLAKMIAGESTEGLTDPDSLPENVETRCKPGDRWLLGNHVLFCGDSTNIDQVERLMGGEKADCVWTDPPYNVAYEGKTKEALTIVNDQMDGESFRQFLRDAFSAMAAVTKEGGAFYIAHADSEGENFRGAAREAGWLIKQCLVWVKQTIVMGRQDYHWKHEPILYGWKAGAAHHWYADRKQSTVLEFNKPNRNAEHPTMKPVELVEYCLANSSAPKNVVLDLFGGSGTTLIACEKLNRSARLMELDPRYADVIIQRWEDFTGKEAVLDGNG